MVSKYYLLIGFILIAALTGCSTNEKNDISSKLKNYKVSQTSDEMTDGDFIYRLISEKEEYPNHESVKVYAELEYVGYKDEITIQHAASPFFFPIQEKIRGYTIPYPMIEPLISTTLKRGVPYREEYIGSGAFSEIDNKEYRVFMEDFIEYGFPTGYYIIEGYADFWIQNNKISEPQKFHLTATIDFKVK